MKYSWRALIYMEKVSFDGMHKVPLEKKNIIYYSFAISFVVDLLSLYCDVPLVSLNLHCHNGIEP